MAALGGHGMASKGATTLRECRGDGLATGAAQPDLHESAHSHQRGGENGIPNICVIRAFMALTNSGARGAFSSDCRSSPTLTCSQARLSCSLSVRGSRKGRPEGSMFRIDGSPLIWPRTIEPGDVRAVELDFEMTGDLLRAREEAWNDLTPVAELVSKLEWVSIRVYATYRAGGGFFQWTGHLFRQRIESARERLPRPRWLFV